MALNTRFGFLIATGALVAAAAAAAPARADAPPARTAPSAAGCQPWGGRPCLLPFPNNLFTRPDRSAATGLRVQLPPAAMPATWRGERIDTAEYDRDDGFGAGSTVIVHVPGLDNEAAFERSGAVSLAETSQSYAPNAPIVVIDERTGARQLIWCELDPEASSAQARNLLVHPAAALAPGDSYVVALRGLRGAAGRLLAAPRWFERLRESASLPLAERPQRARYARIFAVLQRAGIARRELYEAWDFTVSSTQSTTGRLLAIRNNAFAQLGDYDLADGLLAGRPPSFAVTSVDQLTPQLRRVQGTLTVPCYLLTCAEGVTSDFYYPSQGPDALPGQLPGNVDLAPFECIVPTRASPTHPARIVLYGHGFLSFRGEVEAEDVQQLALRYDIALCATDWSGLAKSDASFLLHTFGDANALPALVDTVQQGVLNTLYLGRLMLDREGFAANPAFRTASEPMLDTSHLYYYGNSDGGILGGVLTAVAPDFRRAVLGVTGSDFFNLLVPRGAAFSYFGRIALHGYLDESTHPLVLDLLQQLWERADPGGYGAHMTTQPLPDTPLHVVLLQAAYGDFEVSDYAAAVEARTIGAAAYEPALRLIGDRNQDRNLFYGIPPVTASPYGGSAIVLWDSGPGLTPAPALAALPPALPALAGTPSHDPHEDPRYTPAAQQQVSDFLAPAGALVDVCSGQPCVPPWYEP
jgi:hypothetical protein